MSMIVKAGEPYDCKKTKFATEKDAEYFIKKLKATSIRHEKPTRSYLCPFCMLWHLTSKTKEEVDVVNKLKAKIEKLSADLTKKNATLFELSQKYQDAKKELKELKTISTTSND